jgi:hypothetical protein
MAGAQACRATWSIFATCRSQTFDVSGSRLGSFHPGCRLTSTDRAVRSEDRRRNGVRPRSPEKLTGSQLL